MLYLKHFRAPQHHRSTPATLICAIGVAFAGIFLASVNTAGAQPNTFPADSSPGVPGLVKFSGEVFVVHPSQLDTGGRV